MLLLVLLVLLLVAQPLAPAEVAECAADLVPAQAPLRTERVDGAGRLVLGRPAPREERLAERLSFVRLCSCV